MKQQLVFVTFFSFLLLILLSISPSSVSAQSLASKSQRWVCLKQTYCQEKPGVCAGNNEPHISLLESDTTKPLASEDTYIVECMETTAGQKCTTGDAALDTQIYGNTSSLSYLNANYKYRKFMYMYRGGGTAANPAKTDANGNIPLIMWGEESHPGSAHKFLALNYYTPTGTTESGDSGTQKLATFSFESQSNNKNCVTVRWDPYGRVFDSQTMDPVMSATVQLQKLRDDGTYTYYNPSEVVGGNFENPQITKEDGVFNFVVPDGTYKLLVASNDYSFPSSTSALPLYVTSKYSKVYSDIYPAFTTEQIVQQGKIQHRDIPVDLKSGATRVQRDAKVMEYSYELSKITNEAIIQGRASHPFAMVNAYSVKVSGNVKTKGKLLSSGASDKDGMFKLIVDQTKIPQDEQFGTITVQKVNLIAKAPIQVLFENALAYVNGIFASNVQAQTAGSTVDLNPIPNYIEGFAYDGGGSVLANATVGIYLQGASKPYYETKADSKGYFKITSENLPFMTYTLKYSSPNGGATSVSTSQFQTQNQAYITQNKINVNAYQNSKGQTGTQVQQTATYTNGSTGTTGKSGTSGTGSTTGSTGTSKTTVQSGGSTVMNTSPNFESGSNGSGSYNAQGNGTSGGTGGTTQVANSSQSNVTVIILMILLLLGFVGAMLGFFIMKKRSPNPYV